ncbi:hypothetical protein HDU67_009455 [Dinochytrium kinnereticum]|nr:hypothetical protein HDU67_009455 [Dinochytrium kinnereticum]
MKLFKTILAAVASVAVAALGVQGACTGTTVTRREWTQLSSSEQTSYINAVRALIARPSNGRNTASPQTMSFADFVYIHVSAAYYVHATAQFYPFHRAMVWAWEAAVQSAGYNGGVPYWDWSRDSQDFARSPIFDPDTLGTTGTLAEPCLLDGFQRRGQFNAVAFPDIYPRFDCNGPNCCLRRVRMEGGIQDPGFIASSLDGANTYDEFRGNSENYWHSTVHFLNGGNVDNNSVGDMSHGAYSPNDLLFYFHHAMIDKIWWRWQKACPAQRTFNYGGNAQPRTSDNAAQLDDTLFSFPHLRVRDVMESDDLCYTYSTISSDMQLNSVAGCADPSITTSGVPASSTAPTSTTATTSAVPTAPVIEREWFQDVVRFLVQNSVTFQPPTFLRRREAVANGTDYGVEAPPSLPATKTVGAPFTTITDAYGDSPVPTLPATKYQATGTLSTATLPAYTPEPTKAGFMLNEDYAPKEVTIKGQQIEIPEGYKVLYMDNLVVKVVPMDFHVNKTGACSSHVRPIALFPKREVHAYTPTNPRCTPPPTPHPTALSYPVLPPKSYYDMMGMDYWAAYEAHQKAKEYVDRCNCDEKCVSPAARMFQKY